MTVAGVCLVARACAFNKAAASTGKETGAGQLQKNPCYVGTTSRTGMMVFPCKASMAATAANVHSGA